MILSVKLLPSAYLLKAHFTYSLISRGRKLRAEYFLHEVLYILKNAGRAYQFEVFFLSLMRLRPLVLLKPLKMGAITYKVAAPISQHRKRLFAVKALLDSSKNKKNIINPQKVAELLLATYFSKKNVALEKKAIVYSEAIENRLFIRYLK
jgi:ribosomal protein S7